VSGFVSIVGAGPWNESLITLAGLRRLQRADVVVADYLVNPNLFLHAPRTAEVIQREAGPRGGEEQLLQPQINTLLIEHARAGKFVVRLKGGDPCMFGRGGEEAQALRAAGIDYELVPGVSSPIAGPELAGIPVTHRDHTPAVTFVSGFEAYEKAGLSVQWEHLARSAGTIVLMMSVRNARTNADRLIEAGRDPSTPAAVVRWGTRGIQRTIEGTLATIADRIDAEKIRAPAVLVVGEVVNVRKQIAWIEQRPLHGRRVVVTRPREHALDLCELLAARGADAVAVPCLEVRPPEDLAALDDAVARVHEFDGVVLSSQPGVAAFFDTLLRVGLDARALAGKLVVAVGRSTADAAAARGVVADLVPDDAHSEGLASLLDARGVLARAWLHVRAAEGRAQLQRAIEGAGGRYELAVAYRTERPSIPAMVLRSLLPAEAGGEGFDAVAFASGKTAAQFVTLLEQAHGSARARELMGAAKIVAIGPVTARAVEELGFFVAEVAVRPDDSALVDAIERCFDRKA
jgi:uroporphyrinogen III methyltransferase/synthase